MHGIYLGFLQDGPHQRQRPRWYTVPCGQRRKQAIEGRENRGELTLEHQDGSEASGLSGGDADPAMASA